MVDSVAIPPEVTPQDPAYIEQMAAKGASAVAAGNNPGINPEETPPAAPVKPDWVPEKFWDASTGTVKSEDMAKSYSELEKRMGQSAQQQQQQPQTQQTPNEQAQQAADTLQSKGLDMQVFAKEYADNGQLSDTAYQSMEKAGISRELVDSFIAGQEALRAGIQQEAFGLVEGKENYTAMVQWAAANMATDEIAAYNAAVNGGNKAAMKLAIQGLQARYAAENGGKPPRLTNGSASGDGTVPFQSRHELTTAMGDPRYAKDEAYRNQVIARLQVSTII